ncbi:MAG: NADH-quinone oxidoreductase subunit H [Zetaproteobacteria bacterium]|jgi:formate hydrogenlyase subunit 4|nr:MAG: NADH-quinone oxidoreductase subunit H [Zetaproteobacteria bacterium]
MESSLTVRVLSGGMNVALVLALAPLFEGILRKVTAKVQSRQGPPLWQPYYDLAKLLGKEDIESGTSPPMQRFAAWLSLAAILTVALLVPMGTAPPLGDAADAYLLIYLLTLCGISTMLAGLAAGSTYSLVGMSREMMSLMTLEPLLAVAVVIGVVQARSLRLDVVLSGSAYSTTGLPLAGILMLIVALFAFQALVGRLPFDVAEAETELMEGSLMEYSGPKLALFKFTQMAKLVVYGALVVALFFPWGSGLPAPVNLVALLAKLALLVLAVTVVAATHARYRIDQAIRYYGGLLGVSLAALLLALYGY